ncbi:MAG: YveK family protein [Acetatifactor sp.]
MTEASNMTKDDVIEIDLQEVLGLLLHRVWLIAICGLVGGIAAFCISCFLIVPQYESSTSVYILNKNDNNTVTYSDVQLGTQLTKDYAQLITSRHVLESVISACQLTDTYEKLAERVEVETISDTRLIEITVTDTDPATARLIANEIRKIASERIMEVMDIQAVNVVDEANLPKEPASPSIVKWTIVGLLLGVVLCAMIIVIRFLLDDTIKTSDDIEKYLELSTLAVIPVLEESEGKKKRKHKEKSAENGDRGLAGSKDFIGEDPDDMKELDLTKEILQSLKKETKKEEGTDHAEH